MDVGGGGVAVVSSEGLDGGLLEGVVDVRVLVLAGDVDLLDDEHGDGRLHGDGAGTGALVELDVDRHGVQVQGTDVGLHLFRVRVEVRVAPLDGHDLPAHEGVPVPEVVELDLDVVPVEDRILVVGVGRVLYEGALGLHAEGLVEPVELELGPVEDGEPGPSVDDVHPVDGAGVHVGHPLGVPGRAVFGPLGVLVVLVVGGGGPDCLRLVDFLGLRRVESIDSAERDGEHREDRSDHFHFCFHFLPPI